MSEKKAILNKSFKTFPQGMFCLDERPFWTETLWFISYIYKWDGHFVVLI